MKIFFILTILSTFAGLNPACGEAASDWKKSIIDSSQKRFSPYAQEAFHKPLSVVVIDDQSVSASAEHLDQELKVSLNIGLLNSSRLSPDSLRMIICHEIGHLLGGAPRRNIPPEWEGPVAGDGLSFMSSEGQADYYAALICFQQLITDQQPDEPQTDLQRAGPVLMEKCKKAHSYNLKASQLCLRKSLAAQDFLNLVKEFPISCETHDSSITPVLIRDSYPGRQCRLDTMISAAQCNESLPGFLDFFDMEKTACKSSKARRPECWYPAN